MTTVSYQNYLDVASSRDVPTFKRRLQDFAAKLDFPLFNATLVVEQPATKAVVVAVNNIPDAFQNLTLDPVSIARDPFAQRLKVASSPIVYDQSYYVSHIAGDLWEEQAPFGYHNGISMPLHLSGGRHFYFGVDRPNLLPSDPDALVRLMADLQLLAVYAQETALRLLLPQVAPGRPAAALSSRELEILKWTLVGKSNGVIGQLLNISLSTVNFHLRAAMKKLGVSSKHQAAAKAQALGLIGA